MDSLDDLIEDFNVAIFTLLDTEEISETLVDVPRTRMKLLSRNVPVTFLAGCLAMSRNMESFRVNQPIGAGTLYPTQKNNRCENDETAPGVVVGSDSCPQRQ
jgi:hypothetical protein